MTQKEKAWMLNVPGQETPNMPGTNDAYKTESKTADPHDMKHEERLRGDANGASRFFFWTEDLVSDP